MSDVAEDSRDSPEAPAGRSRAPDPDFDLDRDFDLHDDFCVLILSYDRPDNVPTLDSLKHHGYTGDWYIVIDHEDDIEPYEQAYGEERVIYFDKEDVIPEIDRGDNFDWRNCNMYARNRSFQIARDLGYDYFMLLDDDYEYFQQRFAPDMTYGPDGPLKLQNLDQYIGYAVEYLERAGLDTICMAQGGDFIGGKNATFADGVKTKRKAMNTFICRSDAPYRFLGSLNEDVNTYVREQQLGKLFLTANIASVDQEATQQEDGGLTDIYLSQGTYVKSFYSVLWSPSSVSLSLFKDRLDERIHHRVDWRKSVPKIVPERVKADAGERPAPVEGEADGED